MPMTSHSGVFDYRETVITLDDYAPSAVQPMVAVERTHDEMGRGSTSVKSDVGHIANIGWQIRAHALDYADIQELTAAQGVIASVAGGGLIVAPSHEEFNTFSKSPLTGVTYAAGVQAAGSPFNQKRVAASDASGVNQQLTADAAAYPSPFSSEDATPLDRVAMTTFNHEPWDSLVFSVVGPGASTSLSSVMGTAYFCGPAGYDAAAKASPTTKAGLGQYACKIRIDGKAKLYEKLKDGSWVLRFEFKLNTTSVYGSVTVTFRVQADCYMNASGAFVGSKIVFHQTPTINGLANLAGAVRNMVDETNPVSDHPILFTVPRLSKTGTTLCPVRLDIARPMRALFQISRHSFPASGYITDDLASFDSAISADGYLSVYVNATCPTGSSVDFALYNESGAALSTFGPLYTNADQTIWFRQFVPTAQQRYAQIKVTLTADSGKTKTPTLIKYGIYREPIFDSTTPVSTTVIPQRSVGVALPEIQVSSVQISPQSTDPNSEAAAVVVDDIIGSLDNLRTGSMRPITISTKYDAGGTNLADLFRGYVLTADAQIPRSNSTRVYPAQKRRKYTLQCVGEWARASEAIVPRKLLGVDPSRNEQFVVTDLIRLYAQMIYPSSMVDVPASAIKLLTENPQDYLPDAGARIVDYIKTLADDWLGAYFLFDESAGTRGMLRLLPQKTAPYNNLAIFEIDHPAGKSLPQFSNAYGTTTSGSQTIYHTFIQAGTARSHVEKPEGNIVTVYGAATGKNSSVMGVSSGGLMTQTCYKVDSYNFLNLGSGDAGYPDGTAPEYMGRMVPIKIVDFKLGSADAINWKARRVFEKACFARNWLTFRAPLLLVTDADDALQVRPRRLRYYDAVQVREYDGSLTQYLVVSCTPSYKKDHVQMAEYVLVTQSNIDTIGVMPPRNSPYDALKKGLGRYSGANYSVAQNFAPMIPGKSQQSSVVSLPEIVLPPIQNLDNTSADFGKFLYMMDYDGAG